MTQPQLQRRYMERRKQTKSFYTPLTGNLFSEVSRVHRLEKGSIKQALETCDTDVLYILPQVRGAFLNPMSEYPTRTDLLNMGVQIIKWYNDSGKIQINGRELDYIPVKRWFDADLHTKLQDVIIAMRELNTLLNEKFCVGYSASVPIELLETPTRTGMDLLKRKLPFEGVYSSLSEDVENIVMGNFSQQRREVVTHEGLMSIDNLYCYDGRLMYGACCREVPVGGVLHDTEDVYVPYVPALYRVDFTIPMGWQHIGLLPVKSTLPNVASMYPHKQREEYTSWCSSYELATAKYHNWSCVIRERVLWPFGKEKGFKGKDPLRHWVDTLVNLREIEVPKRYQEPIAGLIRGAIRHLIIDTIGALHSGERYTDEYAEDIADLYAMQDATGTNVKLDIRDDTEGYYHAKVRKAMTAYQRQMFHPHWSLDIWSKAKDKITKCALSIPYDQLLLIRADAVWTLGEQTHLKDDGRVGTFREKPLVKRGTFGVPKTENAIRRMMTQAKGE